MAKDPKRRQQKLLKKLRKAKEKKKRRNANAQRPEHEIPANAQELPLLECLINRNWKEQAIANVVIARRQSDTTVAWGIFLVDMGCLGVKNAFGEGRTPMAEYRERREFFVDTNDGVPCDPALAHGIIYGGLDYAAAIGFKPHRDFAAASRVLAPRGEYPEPPNLTFGKNGKPLYIAGPNDNVERIMRHLEERLGAGGFHFLVGAPIGEEFGEIDDELGETDGER